MHLLTNHLFIYCFRSYLSCGKFHVNFKDKHFIFADLQCRVPHGIILGPMFILLYINDVPKVVNCDLFLYPGNTYLLYQYLERIKEELTKNFSNMCDWFHFREDETKSILFSTKSRKNNVGTQDKNYGDIKIKGLLARLTLFRIGVSEAIYGWWWPKTSPLPKTCHTYPAMIKLGTVIPYLKKIPKTYVTHPLSSA